MLSLAFRVFWYAQVIASRTYIYIYTCEVNLCIRYWSYIIICIWKKHVSIPRVQMTSTLQNKAKIPIKTRVLWAVPGTIPPQEFFDEEPLWAVRQCPPKRQKRRKHSLMQRLFNEICQSHTMVASKVRKWGMHSLICLRLYIYTYIYVHTLHYITLNYTALHYIPLPRPVVETRQGLFGMAKTEDISPTP